MEMRWLTAQFGSGRCSCRRNFPAVNASVEIEEEEAIRLCRAIIYHYSIREGRRERRKADAERVRSKIEKAYRRELDFLENWEKQLRGADPISEF